MRKKLIMIVALALGGCSMGHNEPVEFKGELDEAINYTNSKSLDNLPESVQADLMPELEGNSPTAADATVKRFRVQANGVDAKAFFASLVKGSEYSVAIHPDVSGRITANLSDVTLDEALDTVRDIYGYDIARAGKVIRVFPAGLRTETIAIDYLNFTRSGRSLTSISNGSVTDNGGSSSSGDSSSSSSGSSASGGTRIETNNESDFWAQLQDALVALVGQDGGRGVIVSPQASVATIRAYPNEIREVRNFLNVSQERLQRQVILEAKILEVTLSDGYQQGINWSNLSKSIGSGSVNIAKTAISSVLPGQDNIASLLGGQTNITISDGPDGTDFSAVLSFMATQGDLNVLSSPRVTAINNQKAVIKVGVDEYFVTGVDVEDVDVSDGSNSTVTVPRYTYEINPFFSGISLDVTPQIDDNGNVLLHVHPAVIEVEGQEAEFLAGAPLARSSIRESDSVIRAQDGDVVVIGGLMKSAKTESVSKVPLLGDIPGLGHLFRNTTNATTKTELVILLKPTIVGVNTWQQELERSRELLEEWFPEGN